MGAIVNEGLESACHCFESNQEDDKVSFVTATSQGYCFRNSVSAYPVSVLKSTCQSVENLLP